MGSKTASKLVLLLGLLVLLVTSAALIFLGSYIIHLSGNINDLYRSTHVFIPTIIILLVGVVLVLLVLIGFFGCILEKKTLLGIFFTFLLIIFLCEISALITGLVFKYKIKISVDKQLHSLIKYYKDEVSLKNEIDYIQSTFQCCGVTNYTDWKTFAGIPVPDSCCKSGSCKFPQAEASFLTTLSPDSYYPYEIGCSGKVEEFIKKKFVYITLILTCMILLQIVSLVATCCIFRNKRPVNYEPFNNGFHV